ncbi:carbon-nitrogen hydrolase family protein [Leifsonia shinshuensis]|uniref:Carbon-nitrogen hydrolase family protein n=1 Tax=Leifsonia shinshuensis TaxID=150026 RepID=A0A7G6YA29_9MICO|nr:carbon-nitrogen hydrolase family protein [Leifsonia shinshuensis]QNE35344.1 carbon-nitrogen hydrolase family protein [Leifsonia shinshuensis]
MSPDTVRVAIVQQPSRVLDKDESLRRAVQHVADAAAEGARIVAFPESWLSCYPAWFFGMAGWDDAVARSWYRLLVEDSIVIGAPDDFNDDLAPLRTAARETGTTIVIGLNERDGGFGGSLFNSQVTIASSGEVINVHRKLTPTHTERIIWGQGDAAGLQAVDADGVRIGGLICWEHFHPLARHALHDQYEQIHIASWPDMSSQHETMSRSYAIEGRCFVVVAAQYLTEDDVPEELVDVFRTGLGNVDLESDVLFAGGSGVLAPDGTWLTEPVYGRATTIIADVPIKDTIAYKHDVDVAGHYSRSDVFELFIDTERRRSVTRV